MSDIFDMNAIYEIKDHSQGQFKVFLGDKFVCWIGDRVVGEEFRHATKNELKLGFKYDESKIRNDFEKNLGQTDGFHDGYVIWNNLTNQYESTDEDYIGVADWLNGYFSGWLVKQAEIDDHIKRRLELAKEKQGLINEIDELRKQVTGQARTAQNQQATIYELRKRIDEVLDYVGDDFTDYYTGVMIESIHEILKGTTNEQ